MRPMAVAAEGGLDEVVAMGREGRSKNGSLGARARLEKLLERRMGVCLELEENG